MSKQLKHLKNKFDSYLEILKYKKVKFQVKNLFKILCN